MKKISDIRLGVQLLCIILTAIGFFTSFEITMTIILVATLLAGPFFCGWLCPFGTIQDSFSRIGRSLKIKKRKVPQALHQYLIYVRYIIFILVMFFSVDIIFQLLSYDPRGNLSSLLKGNGLNLAALAVIASFAVIGIFYDRPFCNYLCYEGAKYGLLSSIRPATIKRDVDKCVGCKKCDKACPMNIEVSKMEQLASTQCVNCFSCIEACPIDDTLSFGLIGFNADTKKRYVTVGLVAVIAISSYVTYSNLTGEGMYTYFSDDDTVVAAVDASDYTVGDAIGLADGTYTGSGDGFQGTTTVEITVADEIITAINVIDYQDDANWFELAEATILEEIIDSQSTDVSAVSGATYSSEGIMSAVADAITSAGGTASSTTSNEEATTTEKSTEEVTEAETVSAAEKNEDTTSDQTPSVEEKDDSTELASEATEATEATEENKAPEEETDVSETSTEVAETTSETVSVTTGDAANVADGTYTGTGQGYEGGTTTVEVTVSSGAITSIDVVSYEDDKVFFERALDTVIAYILADQSTEVSSVSGATYSSEGIMEAVANALASAN